MNSVDMAHYARSPIAAHAEACLSTEPVPAAEAQRDLGDPMFSVAPPAGSSSSSERHGMIAQIRAAHRQRCFWMEKRKRENLSLGSYLRTALGWSLALPKQDRDRINKRAAELIMLGERYLKAAARAAKRSLPEPAAPDLNGHGEIIIETIKMRGMTDLLEAEHTAHMEALAKQLPGYRFVASQKGLGPLGLAIICAEIAADLGDGRLATFADYPTKGKLLKRLGIAVIDNIRQGCLTKSAPKAEWIKHGYNRQRRSRIWTVGTSALMARNERYRRIYLDRKAYVIARAEARGLTVAPSTKIPKGRSAEFISAKHIDNCAHRYAEQRIVIDIWRAWRKDIRELAEIEGAQHA